MTEQEYLVVTLNVYDFVRQDTYSASLLSALGMGLHHSGLQIDESEYTFNNSGIVRMPRLRMPFCRLNESLTLGRYWGSDDDIEAILKDLAVVFRPGTYDAIYQNCNHFVESLAVRLVGVSIPGWVNRSANVASTLGLTTQGLKVSSSHLVGRTEH